MLTLKVQIPACELTDWIVDVCNEVDGTIEITILECAWCGTPFLRKQENHRFCDDPNCRKTASRKSNRDPQMRHNVSHNPLPSRRNIL